MKIKRKNNHCLEEEPKFSWLFCYLKNSFHYLSILLLFFKPVYSLVAQRWKYPPTMWETWVWSLGWEDPLEKGKATHSSILAREFHGLSVQFSSSVMSDSLRPHELQHTRPPCPSPTPGVHSNSRPSSQWCHPAISSSVVPFSSCPQSYPASESFPVSQLFAWGGQSTGGSALASFLPKKSQGWSPSEWTGWIFLQSKGLSRVFSNTTVQKHQFFGAQLSSLETLKSR